MHSSVKEGLASLVCIGMVVSALAMIDARVRERFWMMFESPSSGASLPLFDNLRTLLSTVFLTLRDFSLEHTAMVVFAVVAGALVLFMLRT